MDHRDKQGFFKIRSAFHPMMSSIYVINDWYLLIHTWQSASEQTLPTADNSVPLLHPQNRHASELLVVGLPMAAGENKAKNVLMKHKGLILSDSKAAVTENNWKSRDSYAAKPYFY